jgi:hypothetical protein
VRVRIIYSVATVNHRKPEIHFNNIYVPCSTAQEVHFVSITKISRLALYWGNDSSLLGEPNGTHQHTLCTKICVLSVQAGGSLINPYPANVENMVSS